MPNFIERGFPNGEAEFAAQKLNEGLGRMLERIGADQDGPVRMAAIKVQEPSVVKSPDAKGVLRVLQEDGGS